MKARLTVLALVALFLMTLFGCEVLPPAVEDPEVAPQDVLEYRKASVDQYDAELTFEIDGMVAIQGPIERWSGTVIVEGDEVDGTVQFHLPGWQVLLQGFQLSLPVGAKKVTVVIDFENSDGVITRYTGVAHIVMNPNKVKVHIKLTGEIINPDDGDDDDDDIIPADEDPFYITLIHRTKGYPIFDATASFYLDDELVREFTITETANEVSLPVQAATVAEIDQPYTYIISHPSYASLYGTMKVGQNDWEVDGEYMSQYYMYANYVHYMDFLGEDNASPELRNLSYPSTVSSNVAAFDIVVTAYDDIFLGTIDVRLNGERLYTRETATHTPGVHDGVYDFIFTANNDQLHSGNNNLTVSVYDTFGNVTEDSGIIYCP